MMRFLSLLCLFALLTGCRAKKQKSGATVAGRNAPAQAVLQSDYGRLKSKSRILLQQYRQSSSIAMRSGLERFIMDSLVSPWYGTAWDFNGTTEVPGKGAIACGYFVTTVLRDAGIALNRVKLSQCASGEMIRALCEKNSIQSFSRQSLGDFIQTIEKKGRGLYITGLDFHTGFLWHDGEKIWFIHASYARPKMVIKEDAGQSAILGASAFRMVGKIRFL